MGKGHHVLGEGAGQNFHSYNFWLEKVKSILYRFKIFKENLYSTTFNT